MSVQAVLAPVFALVLLAFVLLFWMGRVRLTAVRAGEVKTSRASPRTFEWPGRTQQVSDCFHNQLELPPLFYALVPLAMLTHKADLLFVVLAWIFVATRWAHAFEHTHANRIRLRYPLFAAGVVILAAMWAIFALRVLASV
jgi:hypothetical protein